MQTEIQIKFKEIDNGLNENLIEGNIEFKDINFSYDTGSQILSNINFGWL